MTIYAGKGAVHFLRSEFRAPIDAYRHMREVAQQVGDRPREAEALYQLGMSCLWAHDFEQALAHARASPTRHRPAAIDAKENSLAGSLWVRGKSPHGDWQPRGGEVRLRNLTAAQP